MSATNSIQLWKNAKAGNRQALESLLQNHQDQIFRFCHAQLLNEALAIEATQETAIRIIKGLNGFQGRAKISTWILGIAHNVCHEIRRKNKRWQQHNALQMDAVLDTDESAADKLFHQIEIGNLKQAISRLPKRQNTVVILRFFEDMSLKEIATTLDISVGTVKASLHQGLGKLKADFHLKDAYP